jgi:hypothetical protein
MFDDDDNEDMGFHFFGENDLPPEERAEIEREFRERLEKARNHPLAKKAKEINTIVDALLESLEPDEEDDDEEDMDDDDSENPEDIEFSDEEQQEMMMETLFHHTKHEMRLNSMTIGAKFAAIAASDSYMMTMENAVLMKIAARNLLAQSAMLQYEGSADPEHIQVLRRAVDEFREIFVEWLATIKPGEDDEPDGWGLFL